MYKRVLLYIQTNNNNKNINDYIQIDLDNLQIGGIIKYKYKYIIDNITKEEMKKENEDLYIALIRD